MNVVDYSAIDAIILAGGQGTRLRTVVSDLPKPLAPIDGKPFLDILLTQLSDFERVRRVVLAVGYKADLIEARYRNSGDFGFRIEFSVERTPLGTGGALLQALPLTKSADVLVLNGDSYVDFDLSALAEAHARRNAAVTMVVVEVEDTSRFGSVQLDTSDDRVLGFAEKSGSQGRGVINAGCYLLARSAFAHLPAAPTSFEREILPAQLKSTYAHVVNGKFIDIGVPESYSLAADYLR